MPCIRWCYVWMVLMLCTSHHCVSNPGRIRWWMEPDVVCRSPVSKDRTVPVSRPLLFCWCIGHWSNTSSFGFSWAPKSKESKETTARLYCPHTSHLCVCVSRTVTPGRASSCLATTPVVVLWKAARVPSKIHHPFSLWNNLQINDLLQGGAPTSCECNDGAPFWRAENTRLTSSGYFTTISGVMASLLIIGTWRMRPHLGYVVS